MESLTNLVREAAPEDPLARALEAILDSGLVIFTRDTEGHFSQLSEVLAERAGILAGRGDSQPPNMRVFDEHGRLLPGSEYPATITRITGNPQREVLRRLVSTDDRHIWLKMSTLPLERGPEGWAVLTVGMDVTDLRDELEAAHAELEAVRGEIAARDALVTLGLRIASQRLTREELIEAISEPAAAFLPGANIFVAEQIEGAAEYLTTPLVHGYGNPLPSRRGRHTAEQRVRWAAEHAHVNLDVQDTDIYGANVVVELTNPVRSIVVAPCPSPSRSGLAAMVAFHPEPHAFTADQITGFELAARLFGAASEDPGELAAAS